MKQQLIKQEVGDDLSVCVLNLEYVSDKEKEPFVKVASHLIYSSLFKEFLSSKCPSYQRDFGKVRQAKEIKSAQVYDKW